MSDPNANHRRKPGRIKRREQAARKAAHDCPSGKRRYRDHGEAVTALQAAGASDRDNGHRPTRAYECERCGGWHMTSKA